MIGQIAQIICVDAYDLANSPIICVAIFGDVSHVWLFASQIGLLYICTSHSHLNNTEMILSFSIFALGLHYFFIILFTVLFKSWCNEL